VLINTMGAQQSSSGPSTWSIQSTDANGNAIGAPITGVDSGMYPDYGHHNEIGGFFGDVFGTIGSGASDIWNLGRDAATEVIHLPSSIIGGATDIAHEAGAAVGSVAGAATDIFSSPLILVGAGAVLLIALNK
jgi:hypothetical protein